jgi:ubiquinone/menaquinone biosynthesis C-methylase UbiE
MLFKPHFVRDYRRMVRSHVGQYSRDTAMNMSVGGGGEAVGNVQALILREEGLRDGHYLIDIGCGIGRTAFALRDMPGLRYLGTDVVPDLLAYARERVARPDWNFEIVDRLVIPERDGQADFLTMFSVLTHLSSREGRRYLAEAVRVMRPGGKIIVSFLDAANETHRRMAGTAFNQIYNRIRGWSVKNVLLDRAMIEQWARDLRLDVKFHGTERLGQNYCVFTR